MNFVAPLTPTHSLRLHAIRYAADGVLLFDLRHPDGLALPGFAPGAHVDLHLPGGLVRSYSLTNDPTERHRYQIGVRRAADSRGGSAWLHGSARVGERIAVGTPRNHFALREDAPHTTLVAGGIGITPLWSMLHRLERLQRPWHLHYRCSGRASAAFLPELSGQAWRHGRVDVSFSDEGASRLDWARLVRESPPGGHLYCCGPASMLDAFQSACRDLSPERVHVEHFAAAATHNGTPAEGFLVTLARSGAQLAVPPGKTILETLEAHGIEAPHACREGLCGACETAVLAGTPDHRDFVLSAADKAAGQRMMICCSRALTPELQLDL